MIWMQCMKCDHGCWVADEGIRDLLDLTCPLCNSDEVCLEYDPDGSKGEEDET